MLSLRPVSGSSPATDDGRRTTAEPRDSSRSQTRPARPLRVEAVCPRPPCVGPSLEHGFGSSRVSDPGRAVAPRTVLIDSGPGEGARVADAWARRRLVGRRDVGTSGSKGHRRGSWGASRRSARLRPSTSDVTESSSTGGDRRTSAAWGETFFCMHPMARARLSNALACDERRLDRGLGSGGGGGIPPGRPPTAGSAFRPAFARSEL